MPETFRLSEVTQYVQQVFEINFEDEFWVSCELHQVSESRGNYYIKLIEKDTDSQNVKATLEARLWRSKAMWIRQKTKTDIRELLQPGMEVKLRGKLSFHQNYGIAFHISDIDLDFALGAMELARRRTHAALKADGIYHANKVHPLPELVHKIAVISSRTAAGWIDFKDELFYNDLALSYHLDLFHSAVQGHHAVVQIINALDLADQSEVDYDVVCILRGGGSKLDLHIFDDERLCRRIAAMKRPVLTAIGHEIDQSLADLTAHSSYKTPTALADGINDHVSAAVDEMIGYMQYLVRRGEQRIGQAKLNIAYTTDHFSRAIDQKVVQLRASCSDADYRLALSSKATLTRMMHDHDIHVRHLSVVDPLQVLARGYTLVSQGGTIVKRASDLVDDAAIEITFHDKKISRT